MVKIIAGEFRSRQLRTIADDESTRPYLSRVKESVFSMFHQWFEGARVLDLFAGVGTVGLEAISRGASQVLMVERNQRIYRVLKQNIEDLGCGDRAMTLQGDALGQISLLQAPRPVDLVFVDPPYAMMEDPAVRQRILDQIQRCRKIMADKGFVILRSPLGPDGVEPIEGFDGPEAHHYRKEWVLIYEVTQDQGPE
jgi:16S rRNA (guanine(966)-N(2))-methyltransferase RsmD